MNTKYINGQFVRNIATVLVAVMVGAFWACSNDESTLGGGVSEETRVMALENVDFTGKAVMLVGIMHTDEDDSVKQGFEKKDKVTIFELDSVTFEKTGLEFETEIYDNDGLFKIENVTFSSPYVLVEVKKEGDECESYYEYCESGIVRSIVDLHKTHSVNVNVLTTLSSARIMNLAKAGQDFDSAQKQAEHEILEAFAIYGTHVAFEEMSMNSKKDKDFPVFLMMNLLLGNNEYFDEVVDDLAEDGLWNDSWCTEYTVFDVKAIADSVDDEECYTVRNIIAGLGANERMFGYLHRKSTMEFLGFDLSDSFILDIAENYLSNFNAVVGYSLEKCDESRQGEISTIPFMPVKCDGEFWVSYSDLPHEMGAMTDPRDGKIYKTTTFEKNGVKQTWLAENLNFIDTTSDLVDSALKVNLRGHSMCYDNDSKNCEIYGRLYTRGAVMNRAASAFSDGNLSDYGNEDELNYQGICPDGWRLPALVDWQNFLPNTYFFDGDDSNTESENIAVARLKSKSWASEKTVLRGLDSYGLNILPAGFCDLESEDTDISCGYLGAWTNFAIPSRDSYSLIYFYSFHDNAVYSDVSENMYVSVRCIKND